MPELGDYAREVMASYAVTLAVIGALVWASVARSRRVRRQLRDVERRNG